MIEEHNIYTVDNCNKYIEEFKNNIKEGKRFKTNFNGDKNNTEVKNDMSERYCINFC